MCGMIQCIHTTLTMCGMIQCIGTTLTMCGMIQCIGTTLHVWYDSVYRYYFNYVYL